MLNQQSLEDRLKDCIGVVVGPQRSWDPVNQSMIQHWCDAIGDHNPMYTDADYAQGTHYNGTIAPPTMIHAWTMSNYSGEVAPGSKGLPHDEDNYFELLALCGYTSVVSVNCDQIYFKPVKPGDDIYHTTMLEAVSELKKTTLGKGYFITELYSFYNQFDEKVVEMRMSVLRYNVPLHNDMPLEVID